MWPASWAKVMVGVFECGADLSSSCVVPGTVRLDGFSVNVRTIGISKTATCGELVWIFLQIFNIMCSGGSPGTQSILKINNSRSTTIEQGSMMSGSTMRLLTQE
jgi:hypothetical protein